MDFILNLTDVLLKLMDFCACFAGVGRTARAGKVGTATTLLVREEVRFFSQLRKKASLPTVKVSHRHHIIDHSILIFWFILHVCDAAAMLMAACVRQLRISER